MMIMIDMIAIDHVEEGEVEEGEEDEIEVEEEDVVVEKEDTHQEGIDMNRMIDQDQEEKDWELMEEAEMFIEKEGK